MAFRTTAALALLLAVPAFAACDSGRDYPGDRGDGEYDLAAMALQASDLPPGFAQEEIPDPVFDNVDWSLVFDTDDPGGKEAQLTAQGRLTNHVAAFSATELGPVFAVTNVSTLYADDDAARKALEQFACGLPINDSVQLDPLLVPDIADGSTGFLVPLDSTGASGLVDTTICFRTGRIVHAIQQTSIPGVEDLALSVRLAHRMLDHVDAAFDKLDES